MGYDYVIVGAGSAGRRIRRRSLWLDRFLLTGLARDRLLSVVYTERNGRIRTISARKASRREQDDYYRNQTYERRLLRRGVGGRFDASVGGHHGLGAL